LLLVTLPTPQVEEMQLEFKRLAQEAGDQGRTHQRAAVIADDY